MKIRTRISTAVMVAVLLILVMAVAGGAQTSRQNFEWIIAKRANVTGNVVIGAGVDVGTVFNLSPATAISVTNGLTLTLASAFQPLESAGTVTMTLPACPAGDIYILQNTANTTINLADAGNAKLTAAAALGQYDTLTLVGDGTYCIETARANN